MVHQERSDLFGTGGRRWLENTFAVKASRRRFPSSTGEDRSPLNGIDRTTLWSRSRIGDRLLCRTASTSQRTDGPALITGVNLVVASSLIGTISASRACRQEARHILRCRPSLSVGRHFTQRTDHCRTSRGPLADHRSGGDTSPFARADAGSTPASSERNHNVAVVAVAQTCRTGPSSFVEQRDYVYKPPTNDGKEIPLAFRKEEARHRDQIRRQTERTFGSLGTGIDIQGRKLKSQTPSRPPMPRSHRDRRPAKTTSRRSVFTLSRRPISFDPTSPSETD